MTVDVTQGGNVVLDGGGQTDVTQGGGIILDGGGQTDVTQGGILVYETDATGDVTQGGILVYEIGQTVDATQGGVFPLLEGFHFPVTIRLAAVTASSVLISLIPPSIPGAEPYIDHRWQFALDEDFTSLLSDDILAPSIVLHDVSGLSEGITVYARIISRTAGLSGIISNTVVAVTGAPPLNNIFTSPPPHAILDKSQPIYVCWEHPDGGVLGDADSLAIRLFFDSDSNATVLATVSDLVGVNCYVVDLSSFPDEHYTFVLTIGSDVYYHQGFSLVGDEIGASGCSASDEIRWSYLDNLAPGETSDWRIEDNGTENAWNVFDLRTVPDACLGPMYVAEGGPDGLGNSFYGPTMIYPPNTLVPEVKPTYFRLAANLSIWADGLARAIGCAYQMIAAEVATAGLSIAGPWGSATVTVGHGLLADHPLCGNCGIENKGAGIGQLTLAINIIDGPSSIQSEPLFVVASYPAFVCGGSCWFYPTVIELRVDPTDDTILTVRAGVAGTWLEETVNLPAPMDCAVGGFLSSGAANFQNSEVGFRGFSHMSYTLCGTSPGACQEFELPEPECPVTQPAFLGGWRPVTDTNPPEPDPDTDPPDPEPGNPPSTLEWPNEPAGMTTIIEDDWQADGSWSPLSGTREMWSENGIVRTTFPGNPIDVISILDHPLPSMDRVLRVRTPSGTAGGEGPYAYHDRSESSVGDWQGGCRELYYGVWLRLASNFYGHPSGSNKMLDVRVAPDDLTNLQSHWIIPWGSGQPSSFSLRYDVTAGGSMDECSQTFDTLLSVFVPGQWHFVEQHIITPSSNGPTGILNIWVDQVLRVSLTNVCDRAGKLIVAFMSGTWGGLGSTLGQNNDLHIGPFRISGKTFS